jgi:heat shock protein HtpX
LLEGAQGSSVVFLGMIKQRSTSTQVWIFIVTTSLLFLILCSQLTGRLGLFIGLILALLFHTLIFIWGDGLLLRKFLLTPLKGQDPWGLNQKVQTWINSDQLNLPEKIELYLLESDLPTAFSFEVPWKTPLVALSDSLIKRLTPQEVEMVLIHQLCQLEHRQSLRFAVFSLIATTLSQSALFLDRIWIPNSVFNRKQRPFLTLFSPLISLFIRISHSTLDQFVIDQHAAQLIGSREKLGRLLWKLEGWSLTHPMDILPATTHLFIVNPSRIRQKNNLLQFHPATRDRLEKLVGSYPV